jgi:hypothetical protein
VLSQSQILQLATNPAFKEGNLPEAARLLTRITGDFLSVARISVWLFDDSKREMRCVDLEPRVYCIGVRPLSPRGLVF